MHNIIIEDERIVGMASSMLVAEATQLHLYCPDCGKVWAHAVNKHPLFTHFYTSQRCAAHGNGTLFPFFDPRSMTKSLLIREFMLELKGSTQRPNGLPEPYDGTSQRPANPLPQYRKDL